jgi:hypothetical protein
LKRVCKVLMHVGVHDISISISFAGSDLK